uniref:Secreted protein n=1 Tax=Ascaris lumbricoides TaxID=6252 RepID=A0A0M3IQL8_ASCLU
MFPWLMTACFYPCIVGPDFWGLVNKHWRMCTAGQMQSPINVDPSVLLFDPSLTPIEVDKNQVNFQCCFVMTRLQPSKDK